VGSLSTEGVARQRSKSCRANFLYTRSILSLPTKA